MRRRNFITLLGGAAAWPVAARAQQGERIRRVAVLAPVRNPAFDIFRAQLQQLGYSEGRDIWLDFRTADGRIDRLPALAEELVRDGASDVILADSTPRSSCRASSDQDDPHRH